MDKLTQTTIFYPHFLSTENRLTPISLSLITSTVYSIIITSSDIFNLFN